MSKKTKPDIKQLRAIGHKLNPVVTIAGKGLSDGDHCNFGFLLGAACVD